MQKVVFYLIYPVIWMLSKLPMGVLYGMSDLLFLVNYHIIGYRKKVVLQNLQLSFPERKGKELQIIRKKFFRYLTDFFVESLKSFTISEKEIIKRLQYKNLDLLQKLANDKKNIILVGGHQANWEWMVGMSLQLKGIQTHAAYTQIKNPYFDAIVKKSRSRFGATMYRATDTIRNIINNKKKQLLSLYCLLSDQSLPPSKAQYWRTFMGVKVPIHTGAETLAKKFDMALVFWSSRRLKRGVYELEFELITDSPNRFKDFELTDIFIEKLERNIKQSPETYLWSHRRFKHRNAVPKHWQ